MCCGKSKFSKIIYFLTKYRIFVPIFVIISTFHDVSVLENPSFFKNRTFSCKIGRICVVYRDYLGIFWFYVFWKIQFIGNRPFSYKIDAFVQFITVIWTFLWFSVDWYKREVFGRISNIFSRQTIWDLSKQSRAPRESSVVWSIFNLRKVAYFIQNEA